MPRKAVRESDLRSLDRRSMYRIFAPLDANERLPRELLMEARRYRSVGRRELAAALWLPAFALQLVVLSWIHASGAVALVVVMLSMGLLYLLAFWPERS